MLHCELSSEWVAIKDNNCIIMPTDKTLRNNWSLYAWWCKTCCWGWLVGRLQKEAKENFWRVFVAATTWPWLYASFPIDWIGVSSHSLSQSSYEINALLSMHISWRFIVSHTNLVLKLYIHRRFDLSLRNEEWSDCLMIFNQILYSSYSYFVHI